MRRVGWLERDLVGDMSEHECETWLWTTAAAKTALRSRGFWAAVLAASSVALLTAVPALFLAIPAVYLARFGVALLNVRERRAALLLAHQLPIELPLSASFSDARARLLIERLGSARRAIDSAALSGPVGSAFSVTGLIDRVPHLERDVVVLAARVEYLKRFLDSSPPAGPLAEVARFEAQREGLDGADPEQLTRAGARCREHIDLISGLTDRMNTSYRMAEDLLRALEQLPAKIVGLQMTRIESCDCRSADAGKELTAIMESFGALERAISDLPCSDTLPQLQPRSTVDPSTDVREQ